MALPVLPALPSLLTRERWPAMLLLTALAVAQAGAAAVVAFTTRDLFSVLAQQPDLPAAWALSGDNKMMKTAGLSVVVMIFMAGLIALVQVAERAVSEHFGQSYATQLRILLFSHFTQVSSHALAQKRLGSLALRFTGDLAAVKSWVSRGFSRLLSAVVVMPVTMGVLWIIHPQFAVTTLLVFSGCLLIMALYAPFLRPCYRRLRSQRARLAATMNERIPVAPELRLLGRQHKELHSLKNASDRLRSAAVKRAAASALLRSMPDIACGVAGAAMLF